MRDTAVPDVMSREAGPAPCSNRAGQQRRGRAMLLVGALFFNLRVVAQVPHGGTGGTGDNAAPASASAFPSSGSTLVPYRVVGDAIDTPLTATPGDAMRGRAIVANRRVGLCLLCHAGPIPEERFQGNLAPDLAGSGSRASIGQLRLRLVDARRLNPDSVMPAYYQTENLALVPPALRGKPILDAQQIEDVVAFLHTLETP